ncbi:MAG: Zinc/iron permease [Piptocephalis tieghemiana]|nr:MAG: Zinc/iron permease [Piptocephalis tieghemiana]
MLTTSLFSQGSSLLVFLLLVSTTTSPITMVAAHGSGSQILGGTAEGEDPLPGSEGHVVAHGSIGLAFGLTALACGCSMVGSLLPFLDVILPRFRRFQNFKITESRGFIASMMSFAAGVLLFLVLGDLFPEAGENWSASSAASAKTGGIIAWAWMAGTVIVFLLAKAFFTKWRNSRHTPQSTPPPSASQDDSVATLPTNKEMESGGIMEKRTELEVEAIRAHEIHGHNPHFRQHQNVEFRRLGAEIAIALAIHNFPEGLSTFAATLTSTRIGVLYGIALALHKIPEGMMIALPIYLATGSRWKAFIIASAVGVCAQMLGAVLGYALFVTYWNSAVSGTLFAVATGILLVTVLSNMIPLARRYDEEDKYTSRFILLGILFFSFVASLFTLAG